jgi:mlo protein
MAEAVKARSLEETPTWAVAVVCFVMVLISIIIEHIIHLIGKVRLEVSYLMAIV